MPIESTSQSGQAGAVLARQLVEAIEAHVASPDNEDSYATVSVRAGYPRNYVNKLRAAVAENPEHRIDTSTLEKLAAAIDYEVTLTPKAEKGGST
jgi:hypothetical protein